MYSDGRNSLIYSVNLYMSFKVLHQPQQSIYLFNVRLIAQKNYSIFHYRGEISKINCFECVGFGEMLC
jgi:hypothetical protein